MGFFDNNQGRKVQQLSKEQSDSCPYYIYLMQDSKDKIIAIYKIPYEQREEKHCRLKDFIMENIKEEGRREYMPDYIFRSYYVPNGLVVPEAKSDNLDVIWKLLHEKEYGILEKEISFRNASYALICGEPFFSMNGVPFDGHSYNPGQWIAFLEKDNRNFISNRFSEYLNECVQCVITENGGEQSYLKFIPQLSDYITCADQYDGLVDELYNKTQHLSRVGDKHIMSASLSDYLFPAFFSTNFGQNTWTDKDLLQFMCHTGMTSIQFYLENKEIQKFFLRQGMNGLIQQYKDCVTETRNAIVNLADRMELRISGSSKRNIDAVLKGYCLERIKEIEFLLSIGLPAKTALLCPDTHPEVLIMAEKSSGYDKKKEGVYNRESRAYRSWEEQNEPILVPGTDEQLNERPLPPVEERTFAHFKKYWDTENIRMKESEDITYSSKNKY